MSEKIFKYHELLKLSPKQMEEALENPLQLAAIGNEFFPELVEYLLKILFRNVHYATIIGGGTLICRFIIEGSF